MKPRTSMGRSYMLLGCAANAALICAVLNYLSCVDAEENMCKTLASCDQCLQYAQAECIWCAQKDYVLRHNELDRCDLMANHVQQKCANIVNPTSKVMPTKDDDLTNTTKVKPQEVTIALRAGQTRSFNISVRTPENYPVDVYMLMDMSWSMVENLASVEQLGNDLAVKMREITSRFRVGFGTMVDKPVAPFAEVNPGYWDGKAQIQAANRSISRPWVYRNALSLTTNTSQFEDSVKSQNLSESIDGPDGWLDSLMQVAVCKDVVGWSDKDKARRLVVISTEAEFHIAGDGLLGGIVTPNDGLCKLKSGSDTYLGTMMDYPSLGHLRRVLSENSIVPIFAVEPASFSLYEEVAKYFGEEIGAKAGALTNKSANIVTLIRETYEAIGKTQTVFDNADNIQDIKVESSAYCLEGYQPGQKTCKNVPIGKTVTFEVSVTLERCPADKTGYAQFEITTALGDVIPIKVKYLCDCDCSNKTVHNSTECSGNGRFECGDCYCNDGFTGELCDCADINKDENKRKCMAPNTSEICSGVGDCECGKCVCKGKPGERVDGKYCECSSALCIKDENGICGGPARGECDCNRCKCKPGWTGPSCTCSNETSSCFQNNVECSNHGKCNCGRCVCNRAYSGRYSGKYCEACDGCERGCSFYKDCVRCKMFGTGPVVGDCESSCNATIKSVGDVESYSAKGVKCIKIDDDDDCTFTFILNEADGKAKIFADEEKRCPREEGYLLIIIGVILGIVAIGAALLLIWKLLATIQDRREFAKFEREQQNARWDTSENPIFKQATTTFQNPTYGGNGGKG